MRILEESLRPRAQIGLKRHLKHDPTENRGGKTYETVGGS